MPSLLFVISLMHVRRSIAFILYRMKLTGTRKWLAVTVALPLLLTSCIIEINTNNFSSLNKEQHTHFRPFSLADADKPVSYDDSCVIQRINHHDLELLSKTDPLIWVEGFAPWCGGVTCQNIGRLQLWPMPATAS